MAFYLKAILLLGCSLIAASASPQGQARIFRGSTTVPGEFPSVVSLQSSGTHFCAGAIVDATHVVTAAHCMDGMAPSEVTVVAGAYANTVLEASQQRVAVASIATDPQYATGLTGPGVHDVAVLTLATPLVFSSAVNSVPLSPIGNSPAVGTSCTVVGWGGTTPLSAIPNTYTPSPTLLKLKTKIITKTTCQLAYVDTASQLATSICSSSGALGILPGSGTCQGDSGGPLYCPGANGSPYLAGIVSTGFVACGVLPDVYTDVGQVRAFVNSAVA